jgi:hypothetical protein
MASTPRPNQAKRRGITAPLYFQVLLTSQACTASNVHEHKLVGHVVDGIVDMARLASNMIISILMPS